MPNISLISNIHNIGNTLWALSLVRKKKQGEEAHAFLVLEGVENNTDIIKEFHLTYNKETAHTNTHGIIVARQIEYAFLNDYAQDCHSYTWSVTVAQANALIALVAMEMERGKNKEINYIVMGETKAAGSVGASLDSVGLMGNKKASVERIETLCKNHQNFISRDSLRNLLVQGHNCYSWAVAMVEAIKLTPPPENSFMRCVVRNPYVAVNGNQRGEDIESTQGCLMM